MGCVLSPGTNLSYPPIVSHLISSSSDDILQMRPEGSNLSVIWLETDIFIWNMNDQHSALSAWLVSQGWNVLVKLYFDMISIKLNLDSIFYVGQVTRVNISPLTLYNVWLYFRYVPTTYNHQYQSYYFTKYGAVFCVKFFLNPMSNFRMGYLWGFIKRNFLQFTMKPKFHLI